MKTIYIIHGWTYDISPWEEVAKDLRDLGVRAVLLRVPGLTEASEKVWTIEDYVRWADSEIPDGAVALGHSNGGRILLNLANRKPRKLSKMILLDAAGVYEFSLKRTILRVVAKVLAPFKYIPGLRRLLHKFIGASDYDRATPNMKKTLHNMIMSDKALDVVKITTSTEIIWGDQDIITPLRQGLKLEKMIKGSSLRVVKGWPHSPYLRHKKELAKVIYETLEGE
jgi:pimeloyl-ACP methyl ester carboxylesterase